MIAIGKRNNSNEIKLIVAEGSLAHHFLRYWALAKDYSFVQASEFRNFRAKQLLNLLHVIARLESRSSNDQQFIPGNDVLRISSLNSQSLQLCNKITGDTNLETKSAPWTRLTVSHCRTALRRNQRTCPRLVWKRLSSRWTARGHRV
jgi:hypothetical protein